jgi:hypothetical protein
LFKTLKVIIAVAVMLVMVLSVIPSTAQAGTNGTTMKFLAKGTIYGYQGVLLASDVWFTFSIASVDPHILTLGNNSNDVDYLNFRSFGSGGTISNMSGPDEYIPDFWIADMNITSLYEYGVSKSSVTLKAPGGVVVFSPAPTTHAPTTSGPSSFTPINPVLALAVIFMASFVLIGSVFLLDRRMRM